MTINIPSEYVDILNSAVTSGAFSSPEDAIKHALELLAEEHRQSNDIPMHTSPKHAGRMTAIRAWSKSHPPIGHFVDDSRESIYEGRGL